MQFEGRQLPAVPQMAGQGRPTSDSGSARSFTLLAVALQLHRLHIRGSYMSACVEGMSNDSSIYAHDRLERKKEGTNTSVVQGQQ